MMNEHMRKVSAEEFDAWCKAYPRRLFGGAMGQGAAVEWLDKAASREHPCGQVVATRVRGEFFVRDEVPPADYRVRPDGSCDHEWNPSEEEPGKLKCDFCKERRTAAQVREAHFVRQGEDRTKGLILDEIRRRVVAYQEDPHPLSQGFVRVMNDLLACVEDERYREINAEWATLQDIQPRPCPACLRTVHEKGDELVVRQRREMTPVFTLPQYDNADWYDEVLSSLPPPTERRPLPNSGILADFDDVRVTLERGRRSRIENKQTGAYALVDGYGSARVVGAELAHLLPLVKGGA